MYQKPLRGRELEKAFLYRLLDRLRTGRRPSTRDIFYELIDDGASTRSKATIKRYGPGGKWTKFRDAAVEEYNNSVPARHARVQHLITGAKKGYNNALYDTISEMVNRDET